MADPAPRPDRQYIASSRGRRPRRRPRGQVIVEAAIALPAMVFLILCTLQLIMMQHARVMTEYAAFAAARVGIVRSADRQAMCDAAFVALLPTMRRTDSLTATGGPGTKSLQQILRDVPSARDAAASRLGMEVVQVRIANKGEMANAVQSFGAHLNRRELDFDDIRPGAAAANLMQVQVRYFYELRIPFAGPMLQAIYFAARLGTLREWRGPIMTQPELSGRGAIGQTRARAASIAPDLAAGERTGEGAALANAAGRGRYFLPITASYTMRMQSNAYLQNLLAADGCWGAS